MEVREPNAADVEQPDILSDVLERMKQAVLEIRAIRAERWLAEWPPGHSERPRTMPDYVRQYIDER